MAWIDEYGLPRLLELQRLCVPESTAYANPFTVSEALPYWTNQVDLTQVDSIERYTKRFTYTITMRLHLAKWTEGYDGSIDDKLHTYLEDIGVWFAERPGLQVDINEQALTWLESASLTRAAIVPLGSATNPQKGIAFTLTVPVIRRLTGA